jgi:hypothetical protein
MGKTDQKLAAGPRIIAVRRNRFSQARAINELVEAADPRAAAIRGPVRLPPKQADYLTLLKFMTTTSKGGP